MGKFSGEEKVWLADYMHGYAKNIKNGNEARYIYARINQLVDGVTRKSGMSAEFALSKQRGRALEMVTLKVWKAGTVKLAKVQVEQFYGVWRAA